MSTTWKIHLCSLSLSLSLVASCVARPPVSQYRPSFGFYTPVCSRTNGCLGVRLRVPSNVGTLPQQRGGGMEKNTAAVATDTCKKFL
ncbi:hypothetical protein B0T19DRAFT_417702 [Cercophora scortea]|uniref:Secreted protein n=1 Tax=Cercophora scortea TaxID=314031 RepID=A0AAE0IXX0_9PEZI|nr:hypothetical protein B0T19DRAFT_417702 [Cercophora scortea]